MPFEMIETQNPELRQAVNTLYELSADEQVRAEYEMRMKAIRDTQWRIDSAWEEGRWEIARKMKAMGLSIEQIAQVTGLSREVIEILNFPKIPLDNEEPWVIG